ncbi:TPA: hypothetical protein N0F65_003802 [Lagenidium giganteum]|uniref:Uncharacterized protein n=1 Tax=Lagenidium giganteum TaxID=4803 RepID=A0AAV2YWQ5_9STRA|nr:TPA: hypothetical protein N0F65_003802 [Lagenidium giganteum]
MSSATSSASRKAMRLWWYEKRMTIAFMATRQVATITLEMPFCTSTMWSVGEWLIQSCYKRQRTRCWLVKSAEESASTTKSRQSHTPNAVPIELPIAHTEHFGDVERCA